MRANMIEAYEILNNIDRTEGTVLRNVRTYYQEREWFEILQTAFPIICKCQWQHIFRALKIWDPLPNHIVLAPSHNILKSRLSKHGYELHPGRDNIVTQDKLSKWAMRNVSQCYFLMLKSARDDPNINKWHNVKTLWNLGSHKSQFWCLWSFYTGAQSDWVCKHMT